MEVKKLCGGQEIFLEKIPSSNKIEDQKIRRPKIKKLESLINKNGSDSSYATYMKESSESIKCRLKNNSETIKWNKNA